MPAADITEAIENVVEAVLGNTDTANYQSWLEIYGTDNPTSGPPFFPFDRGIPDQRTVSDWEIPSLEVLSQLPAPANPFNETEAQLVIDIVFRTCEAVEAAQIAGRITQDQEDAVVDQYNIAWPF